MFSKIVGERHSEDLGLRFTYLLDNTPDISSFTNNHIAAGFNIDDVKTDGKLSNNRADFIAKTADGTVWMIEPKGRTELDLPRKMRRLRQ